MRVDIRTTAICCLFCCLLAAACAKPIQAPVAKPGAAQTVNTGAVVQLDGKASSDPQGKPLYFHWTFRSLPATSRAALNNPAIQNPSFTADAPGDYVADLVVGNGVLTSKPATVTITAAACGDAAPAIASLTATPASPATGGLVQLSAEVSDADNAPGCGLAQTLAYRWSFTSIPAGSRAALNDPAIVSPSFTADVPGDYGVSLVVTDSSGRSSKDGSGTFTVSVSTCGSAAPAITEISNTPAAPHLGETVLLRATVQDADNDACDAGQSFSYAWRFLSVPPGSAAHLNDPDVVAPSFTPDLAGSYLVGLVVTDSTGRSSPSQLAVSVSGCGGAAPVVTSIDATPPGPNAGQVVQLAANVTDADTGTGDGGCGLVESYSYAWKIIGQPAGSAATLNNAVAADPSFTADVPGNYAIQVVATDAEGHASASKVFTVTASVCGSAVPQASIVAPTAAITGGVVALTAVVSDADTIATADGGCGLTQSFTYAWSFVQLPTGSRAQLNDPGAATPSFTADVPGTYLVQMIATDSTGRTSAPATASVDVSACGSNPPSAVASALPAAPHVGQAVQLAAAVTDADTAAGCGLTESFGYAWSFTELPAGSRAALNSAQASNPSFTADVAGRYVAQLVVTDAEHHASAPAAVAIDVGACGSNAPSAAINVSPSAPGIGTPIGLSAQVTDADNDPAGCNLAQTFTYAWSFDAIPPGSAAALSSAAASQPSFTPDLAGSYVVRLVATDSTGLASAPVYATVAVSACGGNAPVLSNPAAAPAVPNTGDVVQLSVAASDADNSSCSPPANQTFTYAWALTQVPAGSRAHLNQPGSIAPSLVADVPGAYAATVVVTDSTGRASAPATVSFTAGACGSNAPSVVATPSNAAPNVGQPVQLAATVTDADNLAPCGLAQTFTYQWGFDAIPAGSAATIAAPTAQAASFIPDVPGTYVARVVATDSTGLASAPATAQIAVSTCGANAPTVSALNPSTASPNVGQSVLFNPAFNDADNAAPCSLGQSFSFRWSFVSLPSGSRAQLNNPSALTPSFAPDVPGAYQLALVVTDSTGRSSAPKAATITASTCGSNAPSIGAVAPSTATPNIGAPVQLTATVTDADNAVGCGLSQTFLYRWAILSLPSGSRASLNNSSASNPSFTPDVAGPYQIGLAVVDSTGLSSSLATVTVIASPCGGAVPTAVICVSSPGPFTCSSPYSFSRAATGTRDVQLDGHNSSDTDITVCGMNETLSYFWEMFATPVGSGAQLSAPTAINPWFTADVIPGTYVVRLWVSDGSSTSTAQTFTVNANP